MYERLGINKPKASTIQDWECWKLIKLDFRGFSELPVNFYV